MPIRWTVPTFYLSLGSAILLACGTSLTLTGCPPEQPSPSPTAVVASPTAVPPTASTALPSSPEAAASVDISKYHLKAIKPEEGRYDPATDFLTANGKGLPPASAKNPTQARLMAIRAAKVTAMRNILKNYSALTGRSIPDNKVQGFLAGVREVSVTRHPDGSITVTVGVKTADVRLD